MAKLLLTLGGDPHLSSHRPKSVAESPVELAMKTLQPSFATFLGSYSSSSPKSSPPFLTSAPTSTPNLLPFSTSSSVSSPGPGSHQREKTLLSEFWGEESEREVSRWSERESGEWSGGESSEWSERKIEKESEEGERECSAYQEEEKRNQKIISEVMKKDLKEIEGGINNIDCGDHLMKGNLISFSSGIVGLFSFPLFSLFLLFLFLFVVLGA